MKSVIFTLRSSTVLCEASLFLDRWNFPFIESICFGISNGLSSHQLQKVPDNFQDADNLFSVCMQLFWQMRHGGLIFGA